MRGEDGRALVFVFGAGLLGREALEGARAPVADAVVDVARAGAAVLVEANDGVQPQRLAGGGAVDDERALLGAVVEAERLREAGVTRLP